MKITIDRFDTKRGGGTLYSVRCAIEFNEEEKSIIRERSLGRSTEFEFDHGFVNYPLNASTPVSPTMLRVATRLLVLIGLPFTYFSPPLATLCWVSAAGLFFYRRHLESIISKVGQVTVSVAQVVNDGSFTVSTFGTPLDAQKIEGEIRTNLAGLKNILTASAEVPATHSFEL